MKKVHDVEINGEPMKLDAVPLTEVRPARPVKVYQVTGKYLPTLRVQAETEEEAWEQYKRQTRITRTSSRVEITEVREEHVHAK